MHVAASIGEADSEMKLCSLVFLNYEMANSKGLHRNIQGVMSMLFKVQVYAAVYNIYTPLPAFPLHISSVSREHSQALRVVRVVICTRRPSHTNSRSSVSNSSALPIVNLCRPSRSSSCHCACFRRRGRFTS
jgi:hypothetical protein